VHYFHALKLHFSAISDLPTSHKLLEGMVEGCKTQIRDLADRYQGCIGGHHRSYRKTYRQKQENTDGSGV
jgi:hypothetical protein